ncbi:MAG: glycoside hydrolase family 3 protein [Chitinispirillaceae bacterium]|nr:glycoside hydrolase family 3 protein [Chitinispirillaceae bacterium]
MSIRKKAGQMILVYNSPYEFLDEHNIGSVLIMQNMLKNPDKLKKTINETQIKMKIPLLVAIDQEGGTVNRLGYLPQWKDIPSAQVMTRWPKDSIFVYQKRVAEALSALGINLNFAPVLDPAENYSGIPTYIDKKRRSYGTASEEIEPPAAAIIDAFSENNIGCVVKHFPGYDVDVNSDFKIAISKADSLQISQYITPFQTLHKQYCGIMMSSILYKNICEAPAVFCPKMVGLARTISPDGIIVTDDLWGVALRSYTYPGQKIQTLKYPDTAFIRIVEYVVKAGNDMLMITYPDKVPLIVDTIEKLAENDPAVLEHVNAAAGRILALKNKLNLFNQ